MRAATLIAPVVEAEKRLVRVPLRLISSREPRFEIDSAELARSVEITDEEILDDLLYPADHRAVGFRSH